MGSKKEVKKPNKKEKEVIIIEEVVEIPQEELEQKLRQAIAILIEMAKM